MNDSTDRKANTCFEPLFDKRDEKAGLEVVPTEDDPKSMNRNNVQNWTMQTLFTVSLVLGVLVEFVTQVVFHILGLSQGSMISIRLVMALCFALGYVIVIAVLLRLKSTTAHNIRENVFHAGMYSLAGFLIGRCLEQSFLDLFQNESHGYQKFGFLWISYSLLWVLALKWDSNSDNISTYKLGPEAFHQKEEIYTTSIMESQAGSPGTETDMIAIV